MKQFIQVTKDGDRFSGNKEFTRFVIQNEIK